MISAQYSFKVSAMAKTLPESTRAKNMMLARWLTAYPLFYPQQNVPDLDWFPRSL
jgi:hypothetical protein